MPHAELKYSNDLNIDPKAILTMIETTIRSHDDAARVCKGRAYPTAHFNHTHILVGIVMIAKPYRDKIFTAALIAKLEQAIKAQIHQTCTFSLKVDYMDDTYITNIHTV